MQGEPAAQQHPPKGERAITLLGKYRLMRELGRGGMGVVYEAVDQQLSRKVALKLMIVSPNASPEELKMEEERFVREAQLAAKLKHPNIVAVYEAGVLARRRYLAMELIEGQPLSTWWKKGSVTIRQQVALLRDVALAVHEAHEQGVLHRDLKPANVLVGAKNHPYITDFGLAKVAGQHANVSLTASGMIVGTPAYMSPEQAQGSRDVDRRTDVYSLGVMLYEMLTGRQPFQGESPIEILMKAASSDAIAPSRINPHLDKAVENICLKALAKSPRQRYGTAKSFADDLSRWLKGEEVRVVAPKRRKPRAWIWAASAAGALLLVIAALVVARQSSRPERPDVGRELARARQCMSAGDYTEALVAYRETLVKDPSNAEAKSGEAEARASAERKAARVQEETEAERERLAAKQREAEERARVAEEQARRAREQPIVPPPAPASTATSAPAPPPPGTAAPPPPPADAWKQAVDLLALVDPGRDVEADRWDWQEGKPVSNGKDRARMDLPYRPPDEYDLRVAFTWLEGSGEVAVVLHRAGRSFAWLMGGWGNTVCGFEMIRGAGADQNPTTARSQRWLEKNREHTALIQVRSGGLRAFLDDRPVAEWKTDYSDLSMPSNWKLRADTPMGLATAASVVVFHRAELLELTGKGAAVAPKADAARVDSPPGPKADPKPVPPDEKGLKPGLIAEFYADRELKSLAARRVDPAIAFRWKDAPAWPGGRRENFSARWTGVLRVPRADEYVIATASDDGVRVVIDGQQIINNWTLHGEATDKATCRMSKGLHRIAVEYFQGEQGAVMILSWASVGAPPAPIGPEFLAHNPADFKSVAAPAVPAPAPAPSEIRTLSGHAKTVPAIAFSPDGDILATASEDCMVKLWEPNTGKELRALTGHAAGVLALVFSPDGRFLASSGYDKRIKLWNVATGKVHRTLEGHSEAVMGLAWSADGRILASAGAEGSVRLWDGATTRTLRVLTGHVGWVYTVAFSPEGKVLVSGGRDNTVRFWEAATGKELRTLSGHSGAVRCLCFSPDGKVVASSSEDNTIKFWEAASAKELRSLTGHQTVVGSIAFSPDGALLASASNDKTAKLWDAATGKELHSFTGHAGLVRSVAFSKDGKVLASSCDDGTVKLWDVRLK